MSRPVLRKESLPIQDAVVRQIAIGMTELFSQTFGLAVELTEVNSTGDQPLSGDVSGVVSVSETNHQGTIAVSFPKTTIYGILEVIYGQKFDQLNRTVKDAVGEISNVLFGLVKRKVSTEGFGFQMSIPSVVVTGPAHQVWTGETGLGAVMTFKCKYGSFHTLVHFEPTKPTTLKLLLG